MEVLYSYTKFVVLAEIQKTFKTNKYTHDTIR